MNQTLFDYMKEQHGVTLLQSDIAEIKRIVMEEYDDYDGTDDPNREVECCKCGSVHKWSDRITKKGLIFVSYLCPSCGDESYYNIGPRIGLKE
jgi:hypothetical protein